MAASQVYETTLPNPSDPAAVSEHINKHTDHSHKPSGPYHMSVKPLHLVLLPLNLVIPYVDLFYCRYFGIFNLMRLSYAFNADREQQVILTSAHLNITF